MRFLTTEPFTYNGVYYVASATEPCVMDFPDDARPSIKWYPMDEKALAAVKRLSEFASKAQGRTVPFHKIHDTAKAKLPEPIVIEKEPVADPDQPPPLPGLREQPNSGATMGDMQRGARPSDRDPNKR